MPEADDAARREAISGLRRLDGANRDRSRPGMEWPARPWWAGAEGTILGGNRSAPPRLGLLSGYRRFASGMAQCADGRRCAPGTV